MNAVSFGRPILPTAADAGFAAPPARPADDRLAGAPGRQTDRGFDLPPTAFFRRRADAIQTAIIVTAMVAVLVFALPFLLGR
jgi:hypothetical protein